MNKSLKAALLSALVFPGAGHFFLKKYLRGALLTGATLAAFAVIISQAVARAQQIAEQIQRGEVRLDVTAIAEAVTKQAAGADTDLLNLASAVLLSCWLIGILDAYRSGRVQDKTVGQTIDR